MKRIPSVGWAFFGLAVAIYLVYLLNRGVFVGSDARLNMAPVEVFALENGRSPTAAEILALPTSRLTDAQIIALAQAHGRTEQLVYVKICKYLHLTGISISLGLDGLGHPSSAYPDNLFCPPLKNSN
jgi:hypothetical protein